MTIAILIFGASGDLAEKKIYPALYKLYLNNCVSLNAKIIGYGRTHMSMDDLKLKLYKNLEKIDRNRIDEFLGICSYISGQYDQSKGYLEAKKSILNYKTVIFYLALPPSAFETVASMIKQYIWNENVINRLVIEKPFGRDSESFKNLHEGLSKLFKESEIYRIDHFLAKEMVKNIYFLRFCNIVFSEIWSCKFISTIQIIFKEPFGVSGRSGYFDDNGIVRDVFQNHLLQLASIVGMERPQKLDAESIRNSKMKFLNSIEPIDPSKDVILGQYQGYTEELSKPHSNTCTFAMISLKVDNERWKGVPFILRGGKALNEHKTEIRIQFRSIPFFFPPPSSFSSFSDSCLSFTNDGNDNYPSNDNDQYHNELVIRVQPDEAIYLKILIKKPGEFDQKVITTELDLTYSHRYENLNIAEAYQSLIWDAIKGDQSSFVRDDELKVSWKIMDPILSQSSNNSLQVHSYEKEGRGPTKAMDSALYDLGYRKMESKDTSDDYVWPKQKL